MNKISLLFLAGIMLFPLLHTQVYGQEILTLEEAIRIGLENNYDIGIAKNDREILSNNYGFGKYQFLPNLDAVASHNYDVEHIEQQRDPANPPIVTDGAKSNQFNASVNLEWTIFDGMGMFISYKMLNELQNTGNLNLKATITSKIAEISNAYYQIILEKEKIAVLENTLELSEKRQEIAKAIYEVGRSSKLEYLTAQVDLNADMSALIDQEEAYHNAKVNLNRIMGIKIDTDFEVVNKIEPLERLDIKVLEENLLEQNPNLLVIEKSQTLMDLEMKAIRAERFPEINLNAGYKYRDTKTELGFATTDLRSGYYYGLSGRLNILNGFNINRRIQNSKIEQETNQLLYNQLQANLLASLNNYYLAYQNSLKLFQLETQNLAIAKESEEIAYDRYKLGNANFLELREAQRNAVEAESRLLDASYNIKVAEIGLLRLSGQILQKVPEQP